MLISYYYNYIKIMDSINKAFVDFANIIIDEGIEDDKLAIQRIIDEKIN